MGLAYYRMRQNEKALSTFNIALSIDPKDATARYNEACVLALMGRGDEALGSLKQAISLDGRLQTIASKDKDFEGIRANAEFQSLVQDSKITKTP
jgi:Flp pilus assembly protein TadD